MAIKACDDLVVILGAGASHDCHVPTLTEFVNESWQPPLTRRLFASDKPFQKILNEFPVVHSVVLSYIVAGGPAKTPVESFLRQLIANDDLVSRKQANYITLYLRKLLDTVSRSYLWDGARPAMSAYNVLVHHCHEAMRLGKVSSVSFVSMNYDLLFEQALESQFGIGFDRIENYCGFQPSWSLVKFHGSVNWWHSYDHVKTGQNTGYMKAEHRLIRAIEAGRIVEGNRIQNARIEVRDKWGDQQGDEPVYFPAMAIPVEGKYQAICPDAHVEEIKNALGRNQWKLLVVGFSAKDKDVLDTLLLS